MKKIPLFWLLIVFVGLMILGTGSQIASAVTHAQPQRNYQRLDQVAVNTDLPTTLPSYDVTETPEARVLPPVWSNAGLVLGASVLVLIIVGGVLGARLRQKH